MDSQVKERVVGAAVLVALGVLIIPWVLDGPAEPRPEAGAEAGISLPAVEALTPVRTEVVELAPARSERDASRTLSDSDRVAADAEASPTGATAAAASPSEAASSGENVAGAQSTATRTGEPASESPPPAADPTAAAPAILSADRGAPEAAAARAAWVVQVGAFSEVANADQLARRVDSLGYPAEVSDFRSGDKIWHRVRVGGFASRAQAEVAQSSLAAHGFRPEVVPPE